MQNPFNATLDCMTLAASLPTLLTGLVKSSLLYPSSAETLFERKFQQSHSQLWYFYSKKTMQMQMQRA